MAIAIVDILKKFDSWWDNVARDTTYNAGILYGILDIYNMFLYMDEVIYNDLIATTNDKMDAREPVDTNTKVYSQEELQRGDDIDLSSDCSSCDGDSVECSESEFESESEMHRMNIQVDADTESDDSDDELDDVSLKSSELNMKDSDMEDSGNEYFDSDDMEVTNMTNTIDNKKETNVWSGTKTHWLELG